MPRARVWPSMLLLPSLLVGGSSVSPAMAADEPEAAVADVLDAVAARSLGALDGLVCPASQRAVRRAFGDEGLGIDVMRPDLGRMGVTVTEPTMELLEQDETSALVAVEAALTIEVRPGRMRAFVRELMVSSAEPGDPPPSDDDVESMVPLIMETLGLERRIETVVEVTLEGDEWVVCGGLGRQATGATPTADALISDAGLCALATPAELTELGDLAYDSSTDLGAFCTYSLADLDTFHSATVGLVPDSTLDHWRAAYAPEVEMTIGDAPAFGSGDTILAELDGAVLQVTVDLPEGSRSDAREQATRIGELFASRIDDTAISDLASGPDSPEAVSGPTLCDGLSLAQLNELSGRAFDDAVGDPWLCIWSSSGPATARDRIIATVTDLGLADFLELLADATGDEVDGRPAIVAGSQVIVELDDGRTLDVDVSFDPGLGADLAPPALARRLAGRLAPTVPDEPTPTAAPVGTGLLAGRDFVEDLCQAVPFEELSALSGLIFDDPGFGPDYCEYYVFDDDVGYHFAATSLEPRPISDWSAEYPESTSIEIGGRPAIVARDVFGDLGASAVAIVAVPGHDALTFAASIGVDTSTGVEVDVVAVAVSMAELGLQRLVGTDH